MNFLRILISMIVHSYAVNHSEKNYSSHFPTKDLEHTEFSAENTKYNITCSSGFQLYYS